MAYVETDLNLLRRYTEEGDQQAFSEIVRRYAGMVFSVCRRILNDRARAEEVSQETFFRLMTRPQSVSQSLGGWLHRAATRLAVDERRSEMARRRREAHVAAEAREEVEEPPTVRWAEISPHIDEALARLPEASRLLLIRHFLQGQQQQELAKQERVSAATISRRLKLAADELRRELRRGGVDVMPATLIALWPQHAIEAIPTTLQWELGKMAMFGGARAAVSKSLYAVARQSWRAIQASAHARWAAAALVLSGVITTVIFYEMNLGAMHEKLTSARGAGTTSAVVQHDGAESNHDK